MPRSAKAELLIRRRVAFSDTAFAEFVVWHVPDPVAGSQHYFKYRLAYIVDGRRMIGFDNERGKGDHRHDGSREEAYTFESVDALIDDFVAAVEHWRAHHGEA